MKLSTRVFLVLLRLVIGWHLLFEGVNKVESPSWSSEAYLRESAGPLAPAFRWLAGDSVVDKLTPKNLPADWQAAGVKLHQHFPAALERDWNAYFNYLVKGANLPADKVKDAEAKLAQHKTQFMDWLLKARQPVTAPGTVGPPITAEKTVERRLKEYRDKLSQAREMESRDLWNSANTLFEGDVNRKLQTVKADANRLRAGLKADLDAQTRAMKDALYQGVLDADQRQNVSLQAAVTPDVTTWNLLDWSDKVVAWGLLVVGVCLLAGAFTQPACLLGALFLLLFYLAMPAIPGVPENPKAEGHYFFVNKNIVELVALLVLATVPSGRWLGLDGLLRFLNPRNYRRPAQVTSTPTGRN